LYPDADLRELPLSMRKANLARLLARRPDGIFLSDFEQGEIQWGSGVYAEHVVGFCAGERAISGFGSIKPA
jgi:hypothetical protein